MVASVPAEARRIESVIRAHSLMFDSAACLLELGAEGEYSALTGCVLRPSREAFLRIDSILRAQETLFCAGLIDRDTDYGAELAALRGWMAGRVPSQERNVHRTAILPKNLGFAFVQKRMGFPLFGPYRPRSLPADSGFLLRYKSAAADGIVTLSAVRLDARTELRYRGLGSEIRCLAPWTRCALVKAEDTPFFDARGEFRSRAKPSVFAFDSRSAYLAARRTVDRGGDWFEDPLAYRYAYYFSDEGRMRANLARFLRELLSGMYGINESASEGLIGSFIEKSL